VNQRDSKRSKLLYHARIFALAVLLFAVLIGVVYALFRLGIWHLEPDG
jgi:hypothetical protein